jgi:hypothetical protein
VNLTEFSKDFFVRFLLGNTSAQRGHAFCVIVFLGFVQFRESMDIVLKFGSIFAWAFFSFFTAIPAGVALGLAPLLVGLTAWLSYTAGVIVVVLLGKPVQTFFMKRFGGEAASRPDSPIRRAWDRFGVIGLALLAPVTIGAQTGAVIGIALGAPTRKLVISMSLGAAIWSGVITLAVALGIMAVKPG